MESLQIRRARTIDLDGLVGVWERSVRATHHFLPEGEIDTFLPLVREVLSGDALETWVLVDQTDQLLGFMGLSGPKIEALFFAPEHVGKGGGRRMVAYAQTCHPSTELLVDVNEENAAAVGFYQALGFVVERRSPLDGMGRPYPLLHMRQPG